MKTETLDFVSEGPGWQCWRPLPGYTIGHVYFECTPEFNYNNWRTCYAEAVLYGKAMVDFGLAANYKIISTENQVHVALVNHTESMVDFLEFINAF